VDEFLASKTWRQKTRSTEKQRNREEDSSNAQGMTRLKADLLSEVVVLSIGVAI